MKDGPPRATKPVESVVTWVTTGSPRWSQEQEETAANTEVRHGRVTAGRLSDNKNEHSMHANAQRSQS